MINEVEELVKMWPEDVPLEMTGTDGNVFSPLTPKGVVGVRLVHERTVLVCALTPADVMGEPCDWWRRVWKGSPEAVQKAIRDAWAAVQE